MLESSLWLRSCHDLNHKPKKYKIRLTWSGAGCLLDTLPVPLVEGGGHPFTVHSTDSPAVPTTLLVRDCRVPSNEGCHGSGRVPSNSATDGLARGLYETGAGTFRGFVRVAFCAVCSRLWGSDLTTVSYHHCWGGGVKYYTNYLITMSVLVLILPLEITNKQSYKTNTARTLCYQQAIM